MRNFASVMSVLILTMFIAVCAPAATANNDAGTSSELSLRHSELDSESVGAVLPNDIVLSVEGITAKSSCICISREVLPVGKTCSGTSLFVHDPVSSNQDHYWSNSTITGISIYDLGITNYELRITNQDHYWSNSTITGTGSENRKPTTENRQLKDVSTNPGSGGSKATGDRTLIAVVLAPPLIHWSNSTNTGTGSDPTSNIHDPRSTIHDNYFRLVLGNNGLLS